MGAPPSTRAAPARQGRAAAGPAGGAGRRRPSGRPPGEPRLVGYLYVLPALAVYGLFVAAPFAHAAWLSLFDWDGVTVGRWVGLHNYRVVLADGELRGAFLHSLVLIGFYALLPIAIGLLLAATIARTPVRGLALFRTVLFLPQVIAMVVVAVIWRWIYEPDDGALNQLLGAVGLRSLERSWLGDFDVALPAVGLVGSWVMYGLCMVLFIAGVQKIDPSLYEAARVDGAGAVREFVAVTLPALRNELAVALTLTTIAALRNFDLVYITTKGGPGTSTTVPAFEVYRNAFESGHVGLAAAIGMTLAVVIFAITFLITRVAEVRQ